MGVRLHILIMNEKCIVLFCLRIPGQQVGEVIVVFILAVDEQLEEIFEFSIAEFVAGKAFRLVVEIGYNTVCNRKPILRNESESSRNEVLLVKEQSRSTFRIPQHVDVLRMVRVRHQISR